jgi:hypothetical protein
MVTCKVADSAFGFKPLIHSFQSSQAQGLFGGLYKIGLNLIGVYYPRSLLPKMPQSRSPFIRLWRWIKDQIVRDVPKDIALCEFDCRKEQCTMGEWEMCESRLDSVQKSRHMSARVMMPARVNLSGMWRVHRLDQISAVCANPLLRSGPTPAAPLLPRTRFHASHRTSLL